MENFRIYEEDVIYINVDAVIQENTTTEAQYQYMIDLAKKEGNSFILKRDLMYDYVSTNLASKIIEYLKAGRQVDMRMTWNDKKEKEALQAAVNRFEEAYNNAINGRNPK